MTEQINSVEHGGINDLEYWERFVGPKGLDGCGSINDALSARYCYHCKHQRFGFAGVTICKYEPHGYATLVARGIHRWLVAVYGQGTFSKCPQFTYKNERRHTVRVERRS